MTAGFRPVTKIAACGYLTSFQEGNDLWVVDLRKKETKVFAKLGAESASMQMSADGKMIVVLADGKPLQVVRLCRARARHKVPRSPPSLPSITQPAAIGRVLGRAHDPLCPDPARRGREGACVAFSGAFPGSAR